MEFIPLEERYFKHLADKICVCKEDMLPNELTLIRESYILFKEKLVEIKTLEDEVKRISIELANLKAMQDDKEYDDDEDEDDDLDEQKDCPCDNPLEQYHTWCVGCELRREALKHG